MRMRVTAQGFTAVCKMAMTLRCALLSLFLAAVFPFATPSSHCDDATVDVDMTLQSGATGEDVVLATVNKIEDSGIFPDNFGFLRRMAAVETSDGNTFIADTGGILRIDATTFTFVNIFVPGSDFEDTFQEEFYFEWSNTITGYGDLDVPLYSALAVMVRLNITGHSILSDDINEQAQIWKNLFHLDEDVQVFIEIVQQLEGNCIYIPQLIWEESDSWFHDLCVTNSSHPTFSLNEQVAYKRGQKW